MVLRRKWQNIKILLTFLIALFFAVMAVQGKSSKKSCKTEVKRRTFQPQVVACTAKHYNSNNNNPRSCNPILIGLSKSQSYTGNVAASIFRNRTLLDRGGRSICNRSVRQGPVLFGMTTMARGGSQVKKAKKRSTGETSSKAKSKKKKPSHHKTTLSAPQQFFPVEELTLTEVGTAFEYAVQSTQKGFNEEQFLTGTRPKVKAMLHAMDKAAKTSRGKNVKVKIVEDRCPGDIDAFNFCAAARILSDWRLVRQVPEGYKRYAVSMRMGHKDVLQNIGKIEKAAHDWIDCEDETQSIISSPTLRDLMKFEIDMGRHPTLPHLTEESGGMGLLWLRRQLDFQTTVFQKLLQIPKKYPSSSEAYTAAYSQVYSKYHGAAVKRIFNYSLGKAPEIHDVYKCMNPRRLKEVMESTDEVSINSKKKEDVDRIGSVKPRKSLNLHVQNEKDTEEFTKDESVNDNASKERISLEMEKDAHEHIVSFLDEISPLLHDVGLLLEELNMIDPKKV